LALFFGEHRFGYYEVRALWLFLFHKTEIIFNSINKSSFECLNSIHSLLYFLQTRFLRIMMPIDLIVLAEQFDLGWQIFIHKNCVIKVPSNWHNEASKN
jgi:hypothetical protein